jgi:hypothetical protein
VSVLGYSKKIAERLTAHMAGRVVGSYLSVRFGNVLGSRGSVLGTLSAQVATGGPLTVTHPEVTRYFMTVDEAVQLVLQAAVIGSSGEVLILDMGEPVRIADIARRLARRSAHPIDIVYTGLRPGEKLAEDLLGADEVEHRPRHPLVRHAQVKPLDPDELSGLLLDGDEATLRRRLAECAMAEVSREPPTRFEARILRSLSRTDTADTGSDPLARPAQRHELAGKPIEQAGGGLVAGERPAVRVGHVVPWASSEQVTAAAGADGTHQPVTERLVRHACTGLAAPAEELAEREGSGPAFGQQHGGVPDMLSSKAENQVRRGEVIGGDAPTAMAGDVDASGGHDRDHLGRRTLAAVEQPSRGHADGGGPGPRVELCRQHGLCHDRPAPVGGAEQEDRRHPVY